MSNENKENGKKRKKNRLNLTKKAVSQPINIKAIHGKHLIFSIAFFPRQLVNAIIVIKWQNKNRKKTQK